MGAVFIFFALTMNIVILLLAGLKELFFTQDNNSEIPNMWRTWLMQGLHIFFWGWVARIIAFLIPIQAFFLPLFIICFLTIRAIVLFLSGEKQKEGLLRHIDKVISDPTVFISVLICVYIDMPFISFLFPLVSIWIGIGIIGFIFITIRNQLLLETNRTILALLLSSSFIAMILTALRQSLLIQFIP